MGSVCSCFHVEDIPGSSLNSSNNNEGCKCPNCFIVAFFNKFAVSFSKDQRSAFPSASQGEVSSTSNMPSDSTFSAPSDSPLLHKDGGDQISPELEKLNCCLDELASEDEDVCPTCLEEYTPENPKIITQCCHHYHLSCIYEWMERSPTCPICSKVMIFGETS